MCPKSVDIKRINTGHQGGFLMPLAMFIIVALASVAIAVNHLSSSSFSASVQTGISAQSLYAAESGAQYAAHKLLFNVASAGQADTNCTAINNSSLNFNVAGLKNCTTTLSCTLVTNNGNILRIYNLQSAATCGSGNLAAQRTVAVQAIYE